MKISGLDTLVRQLEDAERAISELDGELGTVNFDPEDPSSIEAAIQQAHEMIDSRIGQWSSNPLVSQITDEMKEKFRDTIIERAASSRLKGAPE